MPHRLGKIAAALGVVIAVSTIVGGVTSFAAKLAASDFITIRAAKEREIELVRQLEQRIENSETLAAQRESALVQRIETLGKTQGEANNRMQAAIDRIYNLLLARR